MSSVGPGSPKALLEIAGTTLIRRLLGQLGPRVDRACIVVPPGDDRIPGAIGESVESIRISYARQAERLGVGHAVLQARHHVEGPFIVVMGDAFYADTLAHFVEAWRQSGAAGAVLVEPPTAPAQPMGRVRVVDGAAVALEKTRAASWFTHTLAGAVILPEAAFAVLAHVAPATTGEIELETAVSELLATGFECAAVPYHSWRTNLNRPEDVRAAESRLLEGGEAQALGFGVSPSSRSLENE